MNAIDKFWYLIEWTIGFVLVLVLFTTGLILLKYALRNLSEMREKEEEIMDQNLNSNQP